MKNAGDDKMNLFRGFIEVGENKTPLEPYTTKGDNELRTYSEVGDLRGYAGVIKDGITLVDIDDPVDSVKLLNVVKQLNIKTTVYRTTQGMHFYFKSKKEYAKANNSGRMTPIGLKVDYKHGEKNGIGNLKLVSEPTERPLLYSSEDGSVDCLPVWLSDLGTKTKSIADLKEGERNSELYNYILTLQKKGLGKDEIRESIKIVNNFILSNPVSDKELETIMRDDSFSDQIFFGGKKGNTFLFDKFAEFIVKEYSVMRINGRLHVFRDGVYVPGDRFIEKSMISHLTLTQAQRREVLAYIDLIAPIAEEQAAARYIAFKNGIFDVVSKELRPFSKDIIITNKIPHNYNPEAYSEIADNVLNNLAVGDTDVRMLLEEAIGYTFYRRNEMRKFFILVGDKGNGKSTFIRMVQNVLGKDNTSSLDLKELDDRFRAVNLFGKLANLGDDISGEYIKDPSQLKRVSAGNTITVEKKGEDAFDFDPYCKLMFAANDIPRIKDPTGAAQDRMIIIPLKARFTKNDPNFRPYLRYELEEEEVMEYLINLGISGLERVLQNQGFTTPDVVNEEMKAYEAYNNPLKAYVDNLTNDDVEGVPTGLAYERYKIDCMDNSFKPVNRRTFTLEITGRGYDTKVLTHEGSRVRCFTKNI